ncbi:hypothetical protein [Nocardioides sp. T2.26MG-1]|uniref:hypothetical protein n=1 Tax=Nocardioides sp. T2.26MG-1 TaxID=3041166 RepID=UPI002477820B|nr:hypothetical protein [Nocardioides sp. T2.26MG-1]CAI9417351.1 hypothetical protein HIDPHFAB_02998 [Nocardioides sp. T2.26MG-1]
MAGPTYTYDVSTPAGMVRFLLNDIPDGAPATAVFSDEELTAVLALEGGSVKRAAAQVIDTNATNEALASKVLRTDSGVQTDGAKLADAMRKHAANLRAQADVELADSEDGFFFDVISLDPSDTHVERTSYPYF